MENKKAIIEGEEINLIALLAYLIDLGKKHLLLLIICPLIIGGIGVGYFKTTQKANSEAKTYEATLMGRSMLLTPNEVENFIKQYQADKNSPKMELVKLREVGLNGFYTTEFILKFSSDNDDIVAFKNGLIQSIVENPFLKTKFSEKIEKEQLLLNSIEEELAKKNKETSKENKDCVLNMLITKADMQMRIKQKADLEVLNDFTKANEYSSIITENISNKKYIIGFAAGFAIAIFLIILLELRKKLVEFRNG
jgi:hypothetical protein